MLNKIQNILNKTTACQKCSDVYVFQNVNGGDKQWI